MPDFITTNDTPMMRQYRSIKSGHTDAILFFRLGDFYEMFLDDAKIASRELELTLTGRGKNENRIPMCGVPYHAADGYISKLITRGYKVAICEQVEDPALTKGITKREVTKIITPGTVIGAGIIDEKDNNYLVAINKLQNNEFGIAYVDITTGEFKLLTVASDIELSAYIERLQPKEALIPHELTIDLPDSILLNHYEPFTIKNAHNELAQFFHIQSLTGFGIDNLSEVLPAAWSLIQYLKLTQKHNLPQITRLLPINASEHVSMDKTTIRNLELVESIHNQNKTGTLFWVLDNTKTAMGARQLKNRIKNPYINPDLINEQLDAVELLKNDLLSREEIREILSKVYDLERLISRIVSEQNNPKDLIALKDSLKSISELAPILQQLEGKLLNNYSTFFQKYTQDNSPFSKVINIIEKAIIAEPPAQIKDGGVIREGYAEELDQLLLSFKNIKEWIAGLEEVERQRTGIKNLKVGFNKVFGYYFEISKGQIANTPDNYIRKQTLTNGERFITPELKEKENILLNGEEKQKELESQLYKEIINKLKYYVSDLQNLAEIIGQIDLLQSLAAIAQKNNYTRPQFVAEAELKLDIKNGRHPVLEKNSSVHFIPNDLHITFDKNRFILITGPNMAGKSTIMRQIALIVIMAQIGSFVPASSCVLSPTDKIFTRIGALDNLYFGQSTFMVEMLETASILNNATKQSLIILDEIGRGTSTFDGMSIACSVSEFIYNQIGARTLFATHYHELTHLEYRYKAFSNFSMKITEKDEKVIFNYQLIPGPADKSYGIHVAKMAGLPEQVVKNANKILSGFEAQGIKYLEKNKKVHQLSLF